MSCRLLLACGASLAVMAAGAVPRCPGATAGEIPVDGMPAVVEIPVCFSGKPVMRVVRDIPLTCDLRSAEGLAFDFYCGDSSCQSCGFYAKSGPEWFYCDGGFKPGPDCRWNHVVIPKECLRAGRDVNGWGRIDGIRFSFWCDGTNDTTCAVANVSVRPLVDPNVLILRDEETPSGDSAKYARVFARTLTALGVRYGIVGDKDIGTQRGQTPPDA